MKNFDNVETVDKDRHANLRVKPNPDFFHAKAMNLSAVTLGELSACTGNFPVVFLQNADTKVFIPVAMFGLRTNENIYYNEAGWDSSYVPMMIQQAPFVIGYDDRKEESSQDLTICLDKKSPYLSDVEGIALFTPAGEETDYLKNRNQLLSAIFEGEKLTSQFTRKIVELGLLSPIEVILQPANGEIRKVTGLHSLNEQKLKALTPAQLQELHSLDFLPACYIILGSMFQLHRLIKLRNDKSDEKIVNFRIDVAPEEDAASPAANDAAPAPQA